MLLNLEALSMYESTPLEEQIRLGQLVPDPLATDFIMLGCSLSLL